jgi:hypothetical protein
MSRMQDKHHNIKMANKFFEDLAKFKYFGKTVTLQDCIHEEMENRRHSEKFPTIQFTRSICYLEIKTHKTIILLVFCIGLKLRLSHKRKRWMYGI